jgi:hypothetical protein
VTCSRMGCFNTPWSFASHSVAVFCVRACSLQYGLPGGTTPLVESVRGDVDFFVKGTATAQEINAVEAILAAGKVKQPAEHCMHIRLPDQVFVGAATGRPATYFHSGGSTLFNQAAGCAATPHLPVSFATSRWGVWWTGMPVLQAQRSPYCLADALACALQLDYARGEKLIEMCPPVNREVIRRVFKLGENMAKRPGFSLRAMSAGLYAFKSPRTCLLSMSS